MTLLRVRVVSNACAMNEMESIQRLKMVKGEGKTICRTIRLSMPRHHTRDEEASVVPIVAIFEAFEAK